MQVIGFFKIIGAASMVAPIDWGQDTCYANTTGAAMDAAPVVLRRINGGANRLGPRYMLRQHYWRRDGCGASSVAPRHNAN